MKNTIFTGMASAIVTPMKADLSVDYEALGRFIDFQIKNGINAIVAVGTTGESATLEPEEQKEVIRFTVERVNKRVPVIAGVGTNNTAHVLDNVKNACEVGADALLVVTIAGYDFVEHNRKPLEVPAFLAIRDALMRAPEPVTLVAIGPLTNIALLLSQCPECKPHIRRLVIMGGSAGRGNCTPNAEFNIAADPEAAACVFRSGIEIVMCGLDVTNQAILTPDYLATLPELNRTGKMLHALFSHYRSGSMQSGLRMHDLCAIAWLVRPDLFTLKPCFVAVETQGEFTSGTTVVDIDGCLGKPANVQVALDLNVTGFQQWVAEVLALVP